MILKQLKDLQGLLKKDREALLSGQYSELGENARQMETKIAQIEATGALDTVAEQTLFEDVKAMAARNSGLLLASLEGAKAAKEQIAAIKRATSELNTYDRDGDVTNVSPQPKKIERRA